MIELSTLEKYDARLLQYGLIDRGYLKLSNDPAGIPGPKTKDAYDRWVASETSGSIHPVGHDAGAFADLVVKVAKQFLYLKEVQPNKKWDKPSTPGPDDELSEYLRRIMRPAPWQDGWAYCAAFAEGVYCEALRVAGYKPEQIKKFSDVMGPHVMTSYNAFKRRGLTSDVPVRGSIWLAQHYSGSSGHAGLVVRPDGGRMLTYEANTSAGPSTPAEERNGDWITDKIRNVKKNGSLTTRGFIHPSVVLEMVTG